MPSHEWLRSQLLIDVNAIALPCLVDCRESRQETTLWRRSDNTRPMTCTMEKKPRLMDARMFYDIHRDIFERKQGFLKLKNVHHPLKGF